MGFQLLRAGAGVAPFPCAKTATLAAAAALVPQCPHTRFPGLDRPSRFLRRAPPSRVAHPLSNPAQRSRLFAVVRATGTGFGLPRGSKGRRGVAMASSENSVQKTEEEWRAILSPEQFRILRNKGTEYGC